MKHVIVRCPFGARALCGWDQIVSVWHLSRDILSFCVVYHARGAQRVGACLGGTQRRCMKVLGILVRMSQCRGGIEGACEGGCAKGVREGGAWDVIPAMLPCGLFLVSIVFPLLGDVESVCEPLAHTGTCHCCRWTLHRGPRVLWRTPQTLSPCTERSHTVELSCKIHETKREEYLFWRQGSISSFATSMNFYSPHKIIAHAHVWWCRCCVNVSYSIENDTLPHVAQCTPCEGGVTTEVQQTRPVLFSMHPNCQINR